MIEYQIHQDQAQQEAGIQELWPIPDHGRYWLSIISIETIESLANTQRLSCVLVEKDSSKQGEVSRQRLDDMEFDEGDGCFDPFGCCIMGVCRKMTAAPMNRVDISHKCSNEVDIWGQMRRQMRRQMSINSCLLVIERINPSSSHQIPTGGRCVYSGGIHGGVYGWGVDLVWD